MVRIIRAKREVLFVLTMKKNKPYQVRIIKTIKNKNYIQFIDDGLDEYKKNINDLIDFLDKN